MKQEILEECIESIDISNNLIKEIIVLDDNSEDQTWFILEEISKINPKLNIKKGQRNQMDGQENHLLVTNYQSSHQLNGCYLLMPILRLKKVPLKNY